MPGRKNLRAFYQLLTCALVGCSKSDFQIDIVVDQVVAQILKECT